MLKRFFDLLLASIGLIVLLPLLLAVAMAVRMSSSGPVLFRQIRVGRGGGDFILYKFRSMTVRAGSEQGEFDAGNSSRVTRIGRFLRATKLDELPQLWNVVRGDMSLVGPRPEIRFWVETEPGIWTSVHTVRPGITDPASIVFRDEEAMLAMSPDPVKTYREVILPRKLDLYLAYIRDQSFRGDLRILWCTILTVIRLGGNRHGATSLIEARPRSSGSKEYNQHRDTHHGY